MINTRRWSGCVACLASLSMLLGGVHHCLADQDDLLSLVRAGHRAARQSIHSFSAKVICEVSFPRKTKLIQTGTYWRSFDDVRLQVNAGSGSEDFLLKGSEIHQVSRGSNPKTGQATYVAARRAATEFLGPLDVWSKMLIDFPGPSGGHYEFDRYLEFARGSIRTTRERKEGHHCICVTLSFVSNSGVEQHVSLWHDVARNYLVWKKTLTYEKSGEKSEAEILEFLEPSPGVFVPIKSRRQSFRKNGELRSFEVTTLSEFQLNTPVPKSVLLLPAIPVGTELFDKIKGTRYPIDENWRRIGPEQPFVITGFPARSDDPEYEHHSQSTTEAPSFSWWIVSGSLAVLVIACMSRIYRHFRLRPGLNEARRGTSHE